MQRSSRPASSSRPGAAGPTLRGQVLGRRRAACSRSLHLPVCAALLNNRKTLIVLKVPADGLEEHGAPEETSDHGGTTSCGRRKRWGGAQSAASAASVSQEDTSWKGRKAHFFGAEQESVSLTPAVRCGLMCLFITFLIMAKNSFPIPGEINAAAAWRGAPRRAGHTPTHVRATPQTAEGEQFGL